MKFTTVALTAVSLSRAIAEPCSKILTTSFPESNITVYIATLVAAGSNFTGETMAEAYNTLLPNISAHCRIAGKVATSPTSHAGFEVWMPSPEVWNKRFLATGNGGWAGAVNYPDIYFGLEQNFATMSTDAGHNSTSDDGSWAADEEANINYAIRAMHAAIVAGKTILNAYYSEEQSWSYYAGCSTGGRQGMVEAQEFPEDFDGILVGSPLGPQSHEEAWEIYSGLLNYPNTTTTFIPEDAWTFIHDEVLRQCDHLDGVVDGLVSDSLSCPFVAETLLCGLNATEGCLTSPQLLNLKRIYAPYMADNNTLIFYGAAPGSELTGLTYYTNAEIQGGYGTDYYRYQIYNDSTWDPSTLTPADVFYAAARVPASSDGASPDLTGLSRAGGKLIHYHGLQDGVVPPMNSPHYYERVLSFMATATNYSSEKKVDDFYRLFTVPGLGHCQGGDGANYIGTTGQGLPPSNATNHSLLKRLIAWVEEGEAPEYVIGSKLVNQTLGSSGGVASTRPVCRWPFTPKYSGGEVDDAGSWTCPTYLFSD